MGWRYRRRVKVGPGVHLNISKSGTSVSLGGRGATYNVNRNGGRFTFSLRGTGWSYTGERSKSGGDLAGVLLLIWLLFSLFVFTFKIIRGVFRLFGSVGSSGLRTCGEEMINSKIEDKAVDQETPHSCTNGFTQEILNAEMSCNAFDLGADKGDRLQHGIGDSSKEPPKLLLDRGDKDAIIRRIRAQNAAAVERAMISGPPPRRQRRSPPLPDQNVISTLPRPL